MLQKPTRKGYNSARLVIKLKTKRGNVKNAFRIIANTDKHVIPVSTGLWVMMERSQLCQSTADILGSFMADHSVSCHMAWQPALYKGGCIIESVAERIANGIQTAWIHCQVAGAARLADMEGWCASVYNISNEYFEIKHEDDSHGMTKLMLGW
ncbi:hypothetical protein F5J12DRAFT_782830 [Pisolithus orientalis]|uniref:uncharacterized protein n=1 Tax=Pisolithus orientalis TaxID=936130 RepID=UPI0022250D24|nr:uncharacterized protein F5J12DRAFT_782830 [Pisolithus orientalis]KAI6006561.1 hypothetical protein F5J12DRAFT_782830 [Pisolithus orientalis]